MLLIDSNIIVYSYLPQYNYLKDIFINESVFASEISRIEVLGYHKLTVDEEIYFKDIFNFIPLIFPSPQIFDTAITIRKTYKLQLGDSIIAVTALEHDLSIYTRNLKDFDKINDIKCFNPIV